VAKQQALDAVGDLIDQVRLGHVRAILRAMQAWPLKFRLLVLAVWFTRRSSTGIRRSGLHQAHSNLSCPRNGQADKPFGLRFCHTSH
jgi:hypothetical protein